MNTFLRAIFVASTAALLAIAMAAPSDAAPRASSRAAARAVAAFDGEWSVAIDTTYGSCSNYRAALRIVAGQVQAVGRDYTAAGAVNRRGVIGVAVSSSAGTALGSGRLVGSRGAGRWRTRSGECAGVWYATRRSY